jgi:hypothetical protein
MRPQQCSSFHHKSLPEWEFTRYPIDHCSYKKLTRLDPIPRRIAYLDFHRHRLTRIKRGLELIFHGLLAGSTLWSIFSFYLLVFEIQALVATFMMLTFFGLTCFLLMLIDALDTPDEPAQVSLAGRIQS